MPEIINYKGLQKIIPDPTGSGGKVINDNFSAVADRLTDLEAIGDTGFSGFSGYSGLSGYSGSSGFSGYSGSGFSGYSGISGYSGLGLSGYSGVSGYSGRSGYSGVSGYSGKSGYSGVNGCATVYTIVSSLGTFIAEKQADGTWIANNLIGDAGNPVATIYYQSGKWIISLNNSIGESRYEYTTTDQCPPVPLSLYSYNDIDGGYTATSLTNSYTVISGISGYSGRSGYSGPSGYSGYSGASLAQSYTVLNISSGSVSVNATSDNLFTVTLTENITLNKPTGGSDGKAIRIRVVQNGTGGWTITPDADLNFGDEVPSISINTNANSVGYITLIYRSSDDVWDVVSAIGGY